jgi:CheY-like chemotaxis protein
MRKRIILIEDDPEDVKLISKVVGQTSPDCSLEVFRDGMNALQFFERYGSASNNLPISLVLLDLKLPQLDGIDLLRAIKRSNLTRHLPVVVVTGTASPAQINEVYQLGANSVIEKHSTRAQAEKSLLSTLDFWLNNNLAVKAISTL